MPVVDPVEVTRDIVVSYIVAVAEVEVAPLVDQAMRVVRLPVQLAPPVEVVDLVQEADLVVGLPVGHHVAHRVDLLTEGHFRSVA